MEASNVIEGSFTTEKFIHFLEYDVVSFLFFSQFRWWQVIASYRYVPHTLAPSLSLLWTMHTSTTTRESKSLFRMLVSVAEVLSYLYWLGFRCVAWVSPALLPRLEPNRGSIFQDQGVPPSQWRCCHCWRWNRFWYVHCHEYHYTRRRRRIFCTCRLLLIESLYTVSIYPNLHSPCIWNDNHLNSQYSTWSIESKLFNITDSCRPLLNRLFHCCNLTESKTHFLQLRKANIADRVWAGLAILIRFLADGIAQWISCAELLQRQARPRGSWCRK